jgi:hypothetical protein
LILIFSCKPPDIQPEVSVVTLNWKGTPPVIVELGNKKYYNPGFIFYHYSVWDDNSYRVGILCGVFFVGMVAFVALLSWISSKVGGGDEEERKHKEVEMGHTGSNKDLMRLLDKDTQASLQPYLIDHQRIHLDDEVQSGNFGEVYYGHVRAGDGAKAPVMIKCVRESGLVKRAPLEDLSSYIDQTKVFLGDSTAFIREVHPHIHKPLGVSFKTMQVFVVYPYPTNGNLRTYIRDQARVLSRLDLVQLGQDVAKGMAYLESRNIYHGELAARNCVVGAKGNAVVSDGALSRDLNPTEYFVPQGNSKPIAVRWAAPELFQGSRPNSQTDVWSYGVLVWELFTRGQKPYSQSQTNDVINDVLQGEMLAKPKGCPEAVHELMESCWNPTTRPPFSTIVDYLSRVKDDVSNADANGNINVAYVEEDGPPVYTASLRVDRPGHRRGYNPGRLSMLDESTYL